MHLGSIVPIEKVSLSLFILILSEIKSKWTKRESNTYGQVKFFIFFSIPRSGSIRQIIKGSRTGLAAVQENYQVPGQLEQGPRKFGIRWLDRTLTSLDYQWTVSGFYVSSRKRMQFRLKNAFWASQWNVWAFLCQ